MEEGIRWFRLHLLGMALQPLFQTVLVGQPPTRAIVSSRTFPSAHRFNFLLHLLLASAYQSGIFDPRRH